MTTALLQTTYFGPVQWFQKLVRYDHCLVEQYDSFQKQTYRNRCVIATANGVQALAIPVEHNDSQYTRDIRISDHNQWRRVHWNALQSAYNESPFFEYYADDIRPFFEKKYDFLIDYNEAIRQKMCELIDITSLPAKGGRQMLYYQLFSDRHGFMADLSIVDLLFNMGPESIFYLIHNS